MGLTPSIGAGPFHSNVLRLRLSSPPPAVHTLPLRDRVVRNTRQYLGGTGEVQGGGGSVYFYFIYLGIGMGTGDGKQAKEMNKRFV